MNTLHIGDYSDNGQIAIVDEDKLCYLVRSTSRGASGLRTISKALLAEFVSYVSQHPEAQARDAREALSGQSDIDKYEYGYEATLLMMAKMTLGMEQVHRSATVVDCSLQKIFYGAPGTGKSHTIKEQTKAAEGDNRVFRTTFHPDSDYATFVGCYKPAMEPKEPIYKSAELINKLTLIKNSGVSYPCHKFAAKYWESLKELSANEIKAIVNACGFTDSMTVEVQKGQAIGEEIGSGSPQKQIVYRFIPQAFTNAYIRAWQTNEPVYLIIEEINRGNCAQIFGDLFQLLDRDDNGYSKYPIIADTDLGNHIRGRLQSVHIEGIDEAILEGQELVLPSNLYILASMNTSDQSLFPIDSAFKRRWDWKYIPIEDAGKGYTIKVNGHEYDWWTFLEAINKEVFELTNSEDKQMGYFFVRRPDGVIDAETLVNKVYFYLWNDVFKDYDLEGQKAFKNEGNKAIAFKEFFAGSKINEALAEQVLLNLGLTYTDHPEL